MAKTGVSATFAMKAEADRLRAQGATLIDLGLGEPDFDTPAHIRAAAVAAMEAGRTRYTSVEGIPALRRAIAARYRNIYGAPYGDEDVVVTSGGKGALFAVIQAILEPGDAVAIFAPYWTSYPEQVKLAGGDPVIVPTREEDRFVPRARDLAQALTPRTRAIIVNSPSNPTGAVVPLEEWEAIIDIANERDLILISDEVYESFVYDGATPFSASALHARLGERLVIAASFSKSYAMTGWRVGYALGGKDLIRAAATVQAHDASQAPTLSQYAALAALEGPQEPLALALAEYARRRAFIVPALRKIPGLTCAEPHGAFYVLPNVTGLQGPLKCANSHEVAMRLLREAGVVTVPGEGFGAPGHVRISYAAPLGALEEGVARIEGLLRRV